MPTHFKGSKAEVRALNAYINLMRASDSLAARMSNTLEAEGLTMGQFGVLEALLHLGPMCQRELGEKLLRSGGNITVVIDNLEKRGWVRRERQKDDRRKIVIHLTRDGRHRIAETFPRHAAAIGKEMSRLEPREQEILRRLCKKLGRPTDTDTRDKSRRENKNGEDSTQ